MQITYQSPMQISPAILPKNTFTEAPPVVFKADGIRYAMISTGHSGVTTVNGNFLQDIDAYAPNAAIAVWGETRDRDTALLPPEEVPNGGFWKRNYYGALHAVTYSFKGETYLLGVMHGENKNEHLGDYFFNNTVKPSDMTYTEADYAGYDAVTGEYHDDWETYYAFIGLTYVKVGEEGPESLYRHDLGPVLWPDEPLLDLDNKKISSGLRHPSAIVDGDYLYLYYLDESPSCRGHRVARAKLDIPEKLRFYKWDGEDFSIPALPDGFDRYDRRFVYEGTAPSKRLFQGYSARFSVAKAAGTDYYLGIEEQMDVNSSEVILCLYRSHDLVHWGEETPIPNAKGRRWYEGVLHYPLFYNKALDSSTCVDPNDFYVVGTYHFHQPQPMTQFVALSVE